MDFCKSVTGLLIVGFITAMPSVAEAQRRTSGVASLGEMGCQKLGGSGRGYNVVNRDVPIGREILRSVAYMGGSGTLFDSDQGLSKNEPSGVACRLAPVNSSPQFKNLTLTFGLAQNDYLMEGSVVVRLSIYRDSNFYAQKTISRGDLVRLPVDVRGIRSVTLEAECVRSNSYGCPNVWFVEDTLRR
jgi:hypothetical protein